MFVVWHKYAWCFYGLWDTFAFFDIWISKISIIYVKFLICLRFHHVHAHNVLRWNDSFKKTHEHKIEFNRVNLILKKKSKTILQISSVLVLSVYAQNHSNIWLIVWTSSVNDYFQFFNEIKNSLENWLTYMGVQEWIQNWNSLSEKNWQTTEHTHKESTYHFSHR